MRIVGWVAVGSFLLGASADGSGPDEGAIRDEVRPFLDAHCIKCHGPAKKKGGFDFSVGADLASIRKGRKSWRGVIGQVETLEMPPEGEPAPAPERRDRVVALLKGAVESFDCDDPAAIDPGPPSARRLTRDEYDRTVRDLLGVPIRSAEAVGMPADGSGSASGFANLAEGLILPPVLMEKYFAAADKALDLLFGKAEHRKALAALLVARPGDGVTPREAAGRVMGRFLRLAYRRPATDEELGRYLGLFAKATARGASFEEAARLMVKAALVSPHFLFRVEKDRGSASSYKVGDHELAVRLSYFLWSTMPDATLGGLADRGALADPATFEAQARRMLADPRARALTDNFAEQWLQIGKLAEARPSTEFFPGFTPKLRQALRDETATFFDKLRGDDRSVLDLLDADYAYLNADLATHYGVPDVSGPNLRRITLPAGSHRGGLLGMGSVLAMTSHTSRTSPTLRGKWVLEVIFGTPPPPPPPDAGKLPEGQGKKGEPPKSFREQMARHSRQAECAACHAKIDPLGYGLENFDAVGRWRDDLGGRPLDTSGKLPGGEAFDGPDQLKAILLGRRDDFERNLIERLMSYALGREVGGDDECAVRRIKASLDSGGHRFSDLAIGVARSVPFLYRRDPEPGPGAPP